jgi:hypothetical protein
MALCAILMTIILFYVPYQSDDFWYLAPFKDYKFGNGPFRLSDGFESIKWHYMSDNARLANISTPITLALFPKWLFNIISGIIILAIFYLSIKLSCLGKSGNKVANILAIALIIFALPWHNNILCADLSLNYVWSSAGVLFSLYIFLNPQKITQVPPAAKILIGIITACAGAMHEAASVPLLLTFIALIIGSEKSLFKTRLWILLSFAVGTIFVCSSPEILEKLIYSDESVMYDLATNNTTLISRLRSHITGSMGFFAFSLLLIITLCYAKIRNDISIYQWKLIACYFGMGLCSYIYFLYGTQGGDRIMWFGDLYSILGAATILQCANTHWHKIVLTTIAIPFSLLTIVHLSATTYWQSKLKQQSDEIYAQFLKSPKSPVIHKLLDSNDIPAICWGKDLRDQFNFLPNGFEEFYGAHLSVIPPDIVNKNPITGIKIKSNHEIYSINGHLVSTDPYFKEYCKSVWVINGIYKFMDDSTLDTYDYINPYTVNGIECYYLHTSLPRKFINKTITEIEYFE